MVSNTNPPLSSPPHSWGATRDPHTPRHTLYTHGGFSLDVSLLCICVEASYWFVGMMIMMMTLEEVPAVVVL